MQTNFLRFGQLLIRGSLVQVQQGEQPPERVSADEALFLFPFHYTTSRFQAFSTEIRILSSMISISIQSINYKISFLNWFN